MSADVSCMSRPRVAYYWAALIVWGLLTGCAIAPASRLSLQGGFPGPCDTAPTRLQSGPTEQQREQTCVAMICRNPDDLATCYCPAVVGRGSAARQPSPTERATRSRK